MEKYNGWTNYATWRVKLEILDGIDPHEWWNGIKDAYDLSLCLKSHVEDIMEQETGNAEGLAYSYAMAFLSDVNWYEIAEHMLEEYDDEEAA